MIFITLPRMIVLLLPIIVAEAVVVVRRTSPPKAGTLGVPLTWGILLLCELGLFQALGHTTMFWNSGDDTFMALIAGGL